MKRTPSEVQLHEDEEVADFRDYIMFARIVGRLARQQNEAKDYRFRVENDMCLAHIISTRNGSADIPSPILVEAEQRWLLAPAEALRRSSNLSHQQIIAGNQDMIVDEDDDDGVTMFKLDL